MVDKALWPMDISKLVFWNDEIVRYNAFLVEREGEISVVWVAKAFYLLPLMYGGGRVAFVQ